MKKTFTLFSFATLFSALSLQAQSLIWSDNLEGTNNWSEIHENSPTANRWVLSSCNPINGSRSYKVNTPQAQSCSYASNETGRSILYRQINAGCYTDLSLQFTWRCNTDQVTTKASVVFSADGISWRRITTGGLNGNGYYYGVSAYQTQNLDLSAVSQVFNNAVFYIGFQFETQNSPASLGTPFTVDDIKVYGNPITLSANAGMDEKACYGSTFELQGQGQFSHSRSYISSRSSVPLNTIGSSTVSEIDYSHISSAVTASSIQDVTFFITHPHIYDLTVTLEAPNGSSVILTSFTSMTGADFYNTGFSSSSTTPISQAKPPFNGSYQPQEPFSNLTGSAKGKWKLKIHNNGLFTGTLEIWEMSFGNSLSFNWSSIAPSYIVNSSSASTRGSVYGSHSGPHAEFTLTVTDGNGCSASDIKRIITMSPMVYLPVMHRYVQAGYINSLFYTPYPQYGIPHTDYRDNWVTQYRWQVRTPGSTTWTDLVGDDRDTVYARWNDNYLVLLNPHPSMDGNEYRVWVRACSYTEYIGATFVLHVMSGSRIAAQSKPEFRAYPNPVTDKLFLEGTSGPGNVMIYNLLGEKVKETTPGSNPDRMEIDLSDLAPGTYAVRAGDESRLIIKK
jgi:subtilisin-like proprotein convertase family protein